MPHQQELDVAMGARGDDGTWRLYFVLGIGDLQFGGRRKQRKGNHVLRLLPSHLGWRHDVFRAGYAVMVQKMQTGKADGMLQLRGVKK